MKLSSSGSLSLFVLILVPPVILSQALTQVRFGIFRFGQELGLFKISRAPTSFSSSSGECLISILAGPWSVFDRVGAVLMTRAIILCTDRAPRVVSLTAGKDQHRRSSSFISGHLSALRYIANSP